MPMHPCVYDPLTTINNKVKFIRDFQEIINLCILKYVDITMHVVLMKHILTDEDFKVNTSEFQEFREFPG